MVLRTEDLMQVHYDEHLAFFKAILDRSYMAYSMAYYGATPADVDASTRSLEDAQEAKLALICGRAGVQGHERILNIGCGFGSLETFLLREYPGVEITGITPSMVQTRYLRERMHDPDDFFGSGRFHLIEGSFDRLPTSTFQAESYDLIFSVGVLEHFSNLRSTFERLASLLKPHGKAFHHLIVAQYVIPGFADMRQTRLRKYFPGGRIWPMDEIERQTEHFDLEASWYINGMNYYRTVDTWHKRFWEHMDQLYPATLNEESVHFWNAYFSFAKIMFAPENGTVVGNGHFLFEKR